MHAGICRAREEALSVPMNATKKLRVVFVLEDLCFGGTQRQTLQLAQRLDRERFEPVIVSLMGETDLDDEARASNIELHHMGRGREVDLIFFLRLLPLLNKLDCDIVVPCMARPNIWARIWGRWLKRTIGKPFGVVGTVRGGGAPDRQHERFLWRYADHIVCNSAALVSHMKELGADPNVLSCIPNGVDTERFAPAATPPSARHPLVVCVARLCEDKDHETLVHAFEKVYSEFGRARLRIVGDGPWAEKVKQLVASTTAQYGTEIVPGTADIRPHLAEAQVFALSSIREGQPNVLLEAMAAGLPIVATNVGGIPELVEDGVNGFLSRPKDPGLLADNLLRVLKNPQIADEMGRANRQKALDQFSFAAMVGAHEAVFERLCKAGQEEPAAQEA